MRIATALVVLLAVAAPALAEERETTSCEICGGTVYQPPKEILTGNVRHIYIDIGTPEHRRYCTRCQRDINNGVIDPSDPPALASRDDEPLEGDNPYGNPYARDADRLTREAQQPRERKVDKEAEGGFGALWYVGAILGAMVFVLRRFLK